MTKAPDALGDRLKAYEEAAEGARLDVTLPIYARIDGRSFSKFTRSLARPYDKRLSDAMIATVYGRSSDLGTGKFLYMVRHEFSRIIRDAEMVAPYLRGE